MVKSLNLFFKLFFIAFTLSACGQIKLPNVDLSGQNIINANPSLPITTLIVETTGSTNLVYLATLTNAGNTVTLYVSRHQGAAMNRTLTLTRADASALFDALVSVFQASLSAQSGSSAHLSGSSLSLTTYYRNGSSAVYSEPVFPGFTNFEIIPTLNQYVESKL